MQQRMTSAEVRALLNGRDPRSVDPAELERERRSESKPPVIRRPDPIAIDNRIVLDWSPLSSFSLSLLREIWNWARGEFCRTKLELRYADHLTRRVAMGEIERFAYEALTFRLPGGGWYTPDFVVIRDGAIELHETKGYHWKADKARMRPFHEVYPIPLTLVKWERGQWVFKAG